MEKEWKIRLCQAALEARQKSYCPYSGFAVGAALLSKSGVVYTGCNIESVAYSPSICAERVAFSKAVSQGERAFIGIAIAGAKQEEIPRQECPPCGVCRQVMMEFCQPEEFRIFLAVTETQYSEYTLKELLPRGFGPENL